MSLIDQYTEQFSLMRKTKTADGEGGFDSEWTASKTFNAAIARTSTNQAIVAGAMTTVESYTVTTSRNIVLKYHDVIRRISDGTVYRITSNGGVFHTPDSSALDMTQVTAERWELTT